MYDFNKIGLKLAGATDSAARAVMPFSGKGDKHVADDAAVKAFRESLNKLDIKLRIIIGEGEKDKAPMLYSGEILGNISNDAQVDYLDLIVDPLECTTNFANGLPDSMSVLAALPSGCIQNIPGTYMEQMLVPPQMRELLGNEINLETPVDEFLKKASEKLKRPISNITITVQDRPRHKELIKKIRDVGAGVSLIESGSISSAMKIIMGKSKRLNILWGTFGAPEGLIIACLARRTGFGFLGRVAPHDKKTVEETESMGLTGKTLTADEWVQDDGVVVMTGIHTSIFLPGVEFTQNKNLLRTHTLIWTSDKKIMASHLDGVLESN